MSPAARLAELRARGIELRLSPDGRRIDGRGPLTDADRAIVRTERLWFMMVLGHEAGGDVYDPRLAFLASAEAGLTAGAVATRMEIAFGIATELAEALIGLALEAGYLRRRGELLEPMGDIAARLAEQCVPFVTVVERRVRHRRSILYGSEV